MIRTTDAGVEFDVRVIPRAHKSATAGLRGHAFLIRLAAPPVDGAANEALIRFLADIFEIPQRAVCIVSGARTRDKRVAVSGLSAAAVQAALLT